VLPQRTLVIADAEPATRSPPVTATTRHTVSLRVTS